MQTDTEMATCRYANNETLRVWTDQEVVMACFDIAQMYHTCFGLASEVDSTILVSDVMSSAKCKQIMKWPLAGRQTTKLCGDEPTRKLWWSASTLPKCITPALTWLQKWIRQSRLHRTPFPKWIVSKSSHRNSAMMNTKYVVSRNSQWNSALLEIHGF